MTQIEQTKIERASATYADLARLFLRMSVSSFGGPAAHLAMGMDEIVVRRQWLTREDYLDLMAAVNLIPGPNSTEVMIHTGYIMKGIPGAILAGACFIVPSLVITIALTALVVAGGSLTVVESIFWGLKPVIVAIVAVAGVRLIPGALKSRALILLAVAAVITLVVLNLQELVVILGAGVIYALIQLALRGGVGGAAALIGAAFQSASQNLNRFAEPIAQAAAALTVPTAWDLFWYFLKIGSILFGSGYVLFAYVQQDLVETFRWLTAQQLLDAIAIGQFTPGPVFTAAGSMGYMTAGLPGALAAAFGIFLPSFFFVIVSAPYIPRMRQSRVLSAFLDGLNAAVVAAIGVVVVELAGSALRPYSGGLEANLPISVIGVLLIAASLVAVLRFKINATWMLIVGGIVGLVVGAVR